MANKNDTDQKLASAFKSLLEERSFDNITINDICERSGTSRRNFYRHFKDKYDLMCWIYQEEFCIPVFEMQVPHFADLMPLICKYWYENKAFMLHALEVKGPNSLREFSIKRVTPYLLKDYGSAFDESIDVKPLISELVEFGHNMLFNWLKGNPNIGPEEYSNLFLSMMINVSSSMYSLMKKPAEESENV